MSDDKEKEKERRRQELLKKVGRGSTPGKESQAKAKPAQSKTPAVDEKRQEMEARRQAMREKMQEAGQRVKGVGGKPATDEAPAGRQSPPGPAQRSRLQQNPAAQPAKTTPPAAPLPQPPRPASPTGQSGGRGTTVPVNRPLPPPPVRRPVQAAQVAPEIDPETKKQIDALYSRFSTLEGDAQLSSVYQAIGEIEKLLVELPLTLDSVRARGYVHSGKLESQLDTYRAQWESLRPRIESTLTDHTNRLNGELEQTSRRVQRISGGQTATLAAAKTAVDGLSNRIDAARRGLENLYKSLGDQLRQLNRAIDQVKLMMTQLDESPEIHLRNSEGPLAAVKSQWQRDGKEGPEGLLFLTDQRLLFEQNEEIVTKKVLGLFKKESEKIQKLWLDVEVSDIESVAHSEEGGFLGMGKAAILELVFNSRASVSRGRFQLKGQDSSSWAALIKRVQSGDINRDRHEEYVAEVAQAESLAFPTQCPNCFAAVPTPARGVRSVTCDFCGAVINPVG